MKKELNLKSRLKGLLCVMLSMVMLFGMTLGVHAEGEMKYWLEYYTSGLRLYHYDGVTKGAELTSSEKIDGGYKMHLRTSSGGTIKIYINGYPVHSLHHDIMSGDDTLNDPIEEDYSIPTTAASYSWSTTSDEYNGIGSLYLSADTHTHSYTWQTISEASETQDGEEVYICDCGDIADRRIESAMGLCFKKAIEKINNAKSGDTVTLDMGLWNSFPKKLMEAMAGRRDIDLVINLKYKGKEYKITIPKDTAVDTSLEWYGPLKLMELFTHEELVK